MANAFLHYALSATAVGIGATLAMDLWAILQKRVFGISGLDYRFVGRWIGHFPKGTFTHDAIGKASPVPSEVALGWTAHYATGILFAGLLLAIWPTWLENPTLLPALLVGIGSIVAPWFVMQPAFGLGIAASRTPKPWTARGRSLMTHTVFACGLFASGTLVNLCV